MSHTSILNSFLTEDEAPAWNETFGAYASAKCKLETVGPVSTTSPEQTMKYGETTINNMTRPSGDGGMEVMIPASSIKGRFRSEATRMYLGLTKTIHGRKAGAAFALYCRSGKRPMSDAEIIAMLNRNSAFANDPLATTLGMFNDGTHKMPAKVSFSNATKRLTLGPNWNGDKNAGVNEFKIGRNLTNEVSVVNSVSGNPVNDPVLRDALGDETMDSILSKKEAATTLPSDDGEEGEEKKRGNQRTLAYMQINKSVELDFEMQFRDITTVELGFLIATFERQCMDHEVRIGGHTAHGCGDIKLTIPICGTIRDSSSGEMLTLGTEESKFKITLQNGSFQVSDEDMARRCVGEFMEFFRSIDIDQYEKELTKPKKSKK